MELIKDTVGNNAAPQTTNAAQQLIEFTWKATRGLVEASESQIRQMVERLGTVGKISPEERNRLSLLIGTRLTDSRKKFLQTIDSHIRTTVEKLTTLTEQEVKRLETAVQQLEKRVQR